MHRAHIIIIGITIAILTGCRPSDGEMAYSFTRFAMDTVVEYTIVAADHRSAREAMMAAHDEVERVEQLLWEGNPESPVHRINAGSHHGSTSAEVAAFIRRSVSYSQATGGAFDITIGPLVDLYGFASDDPRKPADADIASARARVDFRQVRFGDDGVVAAGHGQELAVGGVAKGYAVDRAVEVLRTQGITNALVNAGGDLYAMGTVDGRPWRVGIRHPDSAEEMIEVLHISDAAVATSGDYQRYFFEAGERYHHILDPATGRPGRLVRSATVVAPSAEEADAMATALFVQGEAGLTTLDDRLQAVLVLPGGEVVRTGGESPTAAATLGGP